MRAKILKAAMMLFTVCAAYMLGWHMSGGSAGIPQTRPEPDAVIGEGDEADSGGIPGNYEYATLLEDDTVIILAYTGDESIVFVPEKLNGKTVSAIGERAFYGNADVEQVILPTGITSICREAFAYCPRLQYIFMGEGIGTIENGAFSYCPSLLEIRFPEGLTETGYWVCQNCPQLESVTIPQSMKDIKEGVFEGCVNLRVVYGHSMYAEVYAQKEGMAYVDLDRVEEEGRLVW